MSSPLAKPSPIRRGTLNFGLRRKSSAASLTPSNNSAGSPPNTAGLPAANGTNGTTNGTNGHVEEPSADDNASVSSKTDRRPPKKRMFSILAPRGSKSSMNPDGSITNGHTVEGSELSENGPTDSVNGTPSLQRSSIGSGFFSSQRRGSSDKKHAAELAAEKEKLEEQVKALTEEKEKLEASLEAEKSETSKLTTAKEEREKEWESEREKIRDEVAAQLVERDGEVKSLSDTVAQLKEELETTKASEEELKVYKEQHDEKVKQSVKAETEVLETNLAGVQKTIDLKDATIEKMIAEAAELQEKLTAALEEAKTLREEKEAWMKKETDLQTEMGKIKGAGGCSIM